MKKRTNKKQSVNKSLIEILVRYILLLIIGGVVYFTDIFYKILLPLTLYPIKFLLSLSYDIIVIGTRILVDDVVIEIIPACVAVSAYLLLIILNLALPMDLKTRIYSLFTSIFALLLLNILRIYVLSLVLIIGSPSFDILHSVFWYGLSTILVVGVWFLTIWLYKIKKIPGYSDIKFLKNL